MSGTHCPTPPAAVFYEGRPCTYSAKKINTLAQRKWLKERSSMMAVSRDRLNGYTHDLLDSKLSSNIVSEIISSKLHLLFPYFLFGLKIYIFNSDVGCHLCFIRQTNIIADELFFLLVIKSYFVSLDFLKAVCSALPSGL